ncbi:MAG: DUF397 domain-containing protein [Streptosporangiaceae bacterium]
MNTIQAREVPGPDELARVAWHISTRSEGNGGSCVEAGPLADRSGRVAVRDSRDREGPAIVSTRERWAAFVGGVKGGALDLSA